MIYGTVQARGRSFDLTENGWVSATEQWLADSLNETANPRDFGAADGNPMVAALQKAATILGGTFEATPLPGPPPGTVY
jgi:hypothetical protein